jgi:hypothetical protein
MKQGVVMQLLIMSEPAVMSETTILRVPNGHPYSTFFPSGRNKVSSDQE